MYLATASTIISMIPASGSIAFELAASYMILGAKILRCDWLLVLGSSVAHITDLRFH